LQVKWYFSGCQTARYLGRTQFLEFSEVFLVEVCLEVLLGFAVVNMGLFHVVFLLEVSTPRGVGAPEGCAYVVWPIWRFNILWRE
jgi:hypothetical protein